MANASAARVSIIKLIQSIYTADRIGSLRMTAETNVDITAPTFTVS